MGTKSKAPEGTDVIQIGMYYYPVTLRPEYGPTSFEHINRDGRPICFSRRYTAVQFLWRRERDTPIDLYDLSLRQ